MSAPRTIYLVPARVAGVSTRPVASQRVMPLPRAVPAVVQQRPVQTLSHCSKRPVPSEPSSVEDPLETLLNGGSGQGPPRKRERLNHLTAEEKLNRRKLKNRVAAQTARDRKKARSVRLEEVVRQLMNENQRLREENSRLRAEQMQREWTPAEGTGCLSSAIAPLPHLDIMPQDELNRLFKDLQEDFDLDQLASELPFDQEDFPLESTVIPSSQMGCPVSRVPSSPTSSYESGPSPIPMNDWTTEVKPNDPLLSSGNLFEVDHEESVWAESNFFADGSPYSQSFQEEFFSQY